MFNIHYFLLRNSGARIGIMAALFVVSPVNALESLYDRATLINDSVKLHLFASDSDRRCSSDSSKCIPAPIMKVVDYGVKADGISDDSAALNAALKKASDHGWPVQLPTSKTIIAKSPVIVPNGVPEIFGGSINFTGKITGFLLNGKHEGLANNVRNLKMHNIVIDINENGGYGKPHSVYGIRGSNVSNITIDNVVVKVSSPKGRAISMIAYVDGGEDSEGILIKNSRVKLPGYTSGYGNGVELASRLDFGKHDGAVSLWKATKTPASEKYLVKAPVVDNNTIDGGYYGVSLVGVKGYSVRNNVVKNNMRNISAQSGSNYGIIFNNTLRDSVSSSIHLAFGSSDNRIIYNDIKTNMARGEGLIQANIGAKRNIFENNEIECTSKSGAKYLAYSAIHADGNIFRNNIFKGTFHRAAIAIEAAWDFNKKNLAHRNWNVEDDTDHEWVNSDTDGIVIENNWLDVIATREGAPVIMYSEIKDEAGDHELTNLVIQHSIVSSQNTCDIARVLKISPGNPNGILLNQ